MSATERVEGERTPAHRQLANNQRDVANEMALRLKADDPTHPRRLGYDWDNWIEFVEQVCIPLIDNDGTDWDREQELMAKFRTVSPWYLMTSLVLAYRRAFPGGSRS